MVIELRGVEFVNKGAELMLHAILSRVKERFPKAEFVMEVNHRSTRKNIVENGIYAKTNFTIKKAGVTVPMKIFDRFPKSFSKKFNLISDKDIEVILDASGFAFGDQWGAEKAGERIANHIEKWKIQGKKVILMPQAFGPFKDERLRKKMGIITKYADLVFARDPISYEYIKELSVNSANIRLSPDFTNLIKPETPNNFDKQMCGVAIIPNKKMIVTGTPEDKKLYYNLLEELVLNLLQRNEKPFFLIHESRDDFQIAKDVNDSLDQEIPIVQEENPLKVKGIIKESKAVVTSRFHGLVSCLSQAIPCLSTAWSHKYKMLLEDYDYQNGLLEIDEKNLDDKLDTILLEDNRVKLIEKLKLKALKQKEKSNLMWEEVFKVVEE